MVVKNHLPLRPFVLWAVGVLLFLVLVAGFALYSSSSVFAASLHQAVGMRCVQSPSAAHCAAQDPEVQGCAGDAQTMGQAAIKENGFIIGSVERRFSLKCDTWWARVIDTRIGSSANMLIEIAGTTTSAPPTFIGSHERILYSPMVFGAKSTQLAPEITGFLEIDGIIAPPRVTIPAITIPGHHNEQIGVV